MEIFIPRPSGDEQALAVLETEKAEAGKPVQAGNLKYLIGNRWFFSWCRHSGFTYDTATSRASVVPPAEPGPAPGPVDNSDLLVDPSTLGRKPDLTSEELDSVAVLRPGLVDKQDFWLVSQPTWSLFTQWYGVAPGHEVVRECFPVRSGAQAEADVYQLHVKAYSDGRSTVVAVPRECFVSTLKGLCCKELSVDETDYELYEYHGEEEGLCLEGELSKLVKSAGILDLQAVLLRPKAPSVMVGTPVETMAIMSTSPGLLPFESPKSRSMTHSPAWAEDIISQSSSMRAGLAGLSNLGNTCFMNSSLQCLNHTGALTLPILNAFLSSKYEQDINLDNPLGLGGKLAKAFGGLLHKLWQGGVSYVAPKYFKWQLSIFAPQFGGYAQQDSQELLAFLLDGLHEDLNRIKQKPYIEDDDDGKPIPDAVAAEKAWRNYRARNDSIIVDHFQGLYKSLLVCPKCDHQSVKFDPFMYLSLPLPTASTRTFTITAMDMAGEVPPTQYAVEVPKGATIRDLVRELARTASWPDEGDVLLALRRGQGKLDMLEAEAPVSAIPEPRPFGPRPALLLAYAFHGTAYGPAPGKMAVCVFHKIKFDELLPPSLFHLDAAEVESIQLEYAGGEPMAEDGGDGPQADALEQALSKLLRPFKRPLAAETAREPPETSTGVLAAAQLAPPPASPGAAPQTDAAMDDGMDEPASTSELESPIGEAAADRSKPFDMFALQRPPEMRTQDKLAAASGRQVEQAGRFYVLRRADSDGRKPFFADSRAAAAPNTLNFAAEWEQEAVHHYDRTPWERPVVDKSVALQAERAQLAKSKKVTLDDCMQLFLHQEQLDVDDSWYCSECKDHVQAIKKLDLWSLPEVLVVHLKRFSYSRFSRDKLDLHVQFPLEGLDLCSYLLQPQAEAPVYDLFAISNHYGGLGGGHYTAYCKMPDDGRWYNFDDSHVRPLDSVEELQSPAAYVLFYRRQGSSQGFAFKKQALEDPLSPRPPDDAGPASELDGQSAQAYAMDDEVLQMDM